MSLSIVVKEHIARFEILFTCHMKPVCLYSAFLLNLRYRIYLWLQSCAENVESMVMWQYSFLPTWPGDKILLGHLIIFIWKSTVFPGIWLALSSAIRAWNQNTFSTNYTRVLTSANRSDLLHSVQLRLLFVDIHTQCKHCLHAHHCIISILACDGKTNIVIAVLGKIWLKDFNPLKRTWKRKGWFWWFQHWFHDFL
jgi:hypothetical protein